jgi:two-component system, chemotaxis family, protein-glutamate methylesterase/glutaminase
MVRVLVVDQSPLVRQILTAALARDLELEVVGAAPDPFVARELIVQYEPDVLTLEIDLPRMDGVTFLRSLMCHHPMPAIVVTSAIPGGGLACAALAAGAIDVVHKPRTAVALKSFSARLPDLIKTAAQVGIPARARGGPRRVHPAGRVSDPVIAIGASAGGATALEYVLSRIPADGPGIVVAQQLPAECIRELAHRLNQSASIDIRIAEEGDPISPGVALISPGDSHIVVRRAEDQNVVSLRAGPLVGRQRPSMDMLFLSLAAASGPRAIAVVLAGMSRDGMQGLLEIQRAGGKTLAQGEDFPLGTPKAAIECGVIDRIATLERMPEEILSAANVNGGSIRLMD